MPETTQPLRFSPDFPRGGLGTAFDRRLVRWGVRVALLGVCLAVASATFVGGYALTTVANTIFLHTLAMNLHD